MSGRGVRKICSCSVGTAVVWCTFAVVVVVEVGGRGAARRVG